jgi:hypothetical protein
MRALHKNPFHLLELVCKQQNKQLKGSSYMELIALFYLVDEFCKDFEPKWRAGAYYFRATTTYCVLPYNTQRNIDHHHSLSLK